MGSYRDLINFFTSGQAGVRRKRTKKDFCINCDTADKDEIGSLLRQFLSDAKKARVTNYVLGILLAIVSIDLVFHDEIMEML